MKFSLRKIFFFNVIILFLGLNTMNASPLADSYEAARNKKKSEKKEVEKNIENKEQEKNTQELRKKTFPEGGEGYDYFPWGTTIEEFLAVYPKPKLIMGDDNPNGYFVYDIKNNKGESITRYWFFENKLWQGLSTYRDLDETKSQAIQERLIELYGKPTDIIESGPQYKTESIFGETISYTEVDVNIIWEKSPTFKIEEELIAYDGNDKVSIMWYISSSLFSATITYTNPEVEKKVEIYLDKLIKEAEREKIQAEKDKLNF